MAKVTEEEWGNLPSRVCMESNKEGPHLAGVGF
jgi:hypothetical protein